MRISGTGLCDGELLGEKTDSLFSTKDCFDSDELTGLTVTVSRLFLFNRRESRFSIKESLAACTCRVRLR